MYLISHYGIDLENCKDYNCAAIVNCNDILNVRDKRPEVNGELGAIIDELTDNTKVTLGYVYNNWASIYYMKDKEFKHGFVNVKYLKLV